MTASQDSSDTDITVVRYCDGNSELDKRLEKIAEICGVEAFVGEKGRMESEGYERIIFVAYHKDTPVGFGGVLALYENGDISHIGVLPEYRGRGIGGLIFGKMLEGAKEYGATHICLEVRESNEAALALYKKYGFSVCGVIKNYYRNPTENALRMVTEI